jgi:hypothetical protein
MQQPGTYTLKSGALPTVLSRQIKDLRVNRDLASQRLSQRHCVIFHEPDAPTHSTVTQAAAHPLGAFRADESPSDCAA